jgi:hypothetical protein
MQVAIEFSARAADAAWSPVALGVRAEELGFDAVIVDCLPTPRRSSADTRAEPGAWDVVSELVATTTRITVGVAVDAFSGSTALDDAAAAAASGVAPERVVVVTAAPASRSARVGDHVPVWIDGGAAAALASGARRGGWVACLHRVDDYALMAARFDRMIAGRLATSPAPVRVARFDAPRVLTLDELDALARCGATMVMARLPLALVGRRDLHRVAERLVPYAHSLAFTAPVAPVAVAAVAHRALSA